MDLTEEKGCISTEFSGALVQHQSKRSEGAGMCFPYDLIWARIFCLKLSFVENRRLGCQPRTFP